MASDEQVPSTEMRNSLSLDDGEQWDAADRFDNSENVVFCHMLASRVQVLLPA